MNDSGLSGGGFMTGSNSTSVKTTIKNKNRLPCTIASILLLDPTRDTLIIGDMEYDQITLVGLIRSVKETPTNITYELDDMTGPYIDIKQWPYPSKDDENGFEDSRKTKIYPENSYITVIGSIRSFNSKKSILAHKILPITDMNELTMHILEVTYSHMKLVDLSNNLHKNMNSNNSIDQSNVEDSMINTSFTQGYNSGLNPLAQQILKTISQCNTEEGITVMMIKKALPNISIDQIKLNYI
ncbi:unnamed protein product [Gordionus sp. m RMFG-2023]